MRDLAFVGFLAAFLALGFKRPFLFVLAYTYVTIVSPQRLSYYLLNSLPIALIVAALAMAGWALADDKKGLRIAPRQLLILLLLGYCGLTTWGADMPEPAFAKWEWVWKALAFAAFLPLTLRTRLRIEAYILFLVLSASAIIVTGGIKTLLSGGGYGTLNLMVDSNSGLYEGSTISTVAIAIIPLILWLARFGTIFPPDRRVKLYAAGLIFACLLIPVGTEARTGLVCIGVLSVLMLRNVKRRALYITGMAAAGLAVVPLLPQTFTTRMETISTYQEDSSASTRIAVWKWTWDYVQDNPLGGGFDAYRQNRIQVQTVSTGVAGDVQLVNQRFHQDEARAYHSSYFEMLGEQGFPGFFLFLLIHGIGIVRMEIIRRRFREAAAADAWIAPLATALQNFQFIYLTGSLFLGIAFQPFVWMMIGAQIGFDLHVSGKARAEARRPFGAPLAPQPAG
ncbi:MAG: putative O-glycosylation ligase, exosortase A system-associated [Allosphingosinicella sp.]|uniref:putative O-glycosylation ligase, exosortase A system-associated n=1 Tax=Allosphingosinicella sp. TaxID=2823234 RepID=UPI00395B96D9